MKISHFAYPEILFGGVIFLLASLWFLFFCRQKQNFWDISLLKEIYWWQSIWYRAYSLLLLLWTIVFIMLLAIPLESQSIEKVKKNGIDIEIVFDLSYSMIAKDIEPNRLEVAKRVFVNFVSQLETDRVGLVLFSGKPFQSVPLSYDYDFLKDFISNITMETIDQWRWGLQGTAIWDGLVLASDILSQDKTEREKVIILITDGEANTGVEPSVALKLLKDQGIKTYTIWVWKDKESTIDVTNPLGFAQRILVGGLDEEILKKIAWETWGEYFRADSPEAFQNIIDTISRLEKKELEMESYSFQNEATRELIIFQILLFLGVLYMYFVKWIRL